MSHREIGYRLALTLLDEEEALFAADEIRTVLTLPRPGWESLGRPAVVNVTVSVREIQRL